MHTFRTMLGATEWLRKSISPLCSWKWSALVSRRWRFATLQSVFCPLQFPLPRLPWKTDPLGMALNCCVFVWASVWVLRKGVRFEIYRAYNNSNNGNCAAYTGRCKFKHPLKIIIKRPTWGGKSDSHTHTRTWSTGNMVFVPQPQQIAIREGKLMIKNTVYTGRAIRQLPGLGY